jgi:hypothetical protein
MTGSIVIKRGYYKNLFMITDASVTVATARQKRKSDELTPEEEAAIEAVETGKVKLKTYKNAEEYLKHLDEVLNK